jgi:HEAT repeat protein
VAARSIDDQLHQLDALKSAPALADVVAPLRKTLQSRQNLVVARAAEVARALNLVVELEPQLAEAFTRLLSGADKGCVGKTAILKALASAERGDEEMLLVAAQHVQLEPTWGGSTDVAVEMRCEATAALVRMNSRRMWTPLVKLLADKDAQARATAARALGATGQDQAKLLVHFKILIGDQEPAVMGECFGSIVRLTRSIELVEPFLEDADAALAEAAALALGESRLPAAFEALRRRLDSLMDAELERVTMLAIAMTRQPTAVDCLIEIAHRSPAKSPRVIEALAMYRNDPAVQEKIKSITGKGAT